MMKRPHAVDIAMLTTILLVIAGFIGIPAYMYYVARNSYSANNTSQIAYEIRWGINIPDNYIEKLHYYSPHSFTGDGYRYTVYETLGDVEFRSWNYGVTRQTSSYSDMDISDIVQYITAIRLNADLTEEYYFPIDETVRWEMLTSNNNRLIIIHFRKIGQVHFAEELR
jgi:hypothetical protein